MSRKRFSAGKIALIWMIGAIIWLAAAFLVLGLLIGDCAQVADVSCPNEAGRRLELVWIILSSLALNVVLVFGLLCPGRDGE